MNPIITETTIAAKEAILLAAAEFQTTNDAALITSEAHDAALCKVRTAKEKLLDDLARLIEATFPALFAEEVGGIVTISSNWGPYDDEHGNDRATIELSTTTRYGVQYKLASLTPRHGEQYGASITTASIEKVMIALSTYSPA